MKIISTAMAGTMESSDVSIVIEPSQDNNITIELKSLVEKQFSQQIKSVILETLKELKVEGAKVKVNDKGALDCVIKARLQTAVLRAAQVETFNWGEEK